MGTAEAGRVGGYGHGALGAASRRRRAGALIAAIFRSAGLAPPRPGVATLSGQLTATVIAGGGFVGLLPGYVARFSAGWLGLKILPVTLPDQRLEIGIVTVKNRTLSPLAERFLTFTRPDHSIKIALTVARSAQRRTRSRRRLTSANTASNISDVSFPVFVL